MRTRRTRNAIGIVAIVAAAFASIASADTGNDAEVIGGDNSSGTTAVAFDPDNPSGSAGSTGGESGSTDPGDAEELTTEAGITSGVDSIGGEHTSAGALVTNPNASLAAYDVEVLFNLVSADGTVLASEGESVPYIPAFSTVPVGASDLLGNGVAAASVEVTVTGSFAEDSGWDGVDFLFGYGIDLEVADAAATTGSTGPELTAQVTNPSDSVAESAFVTCVLKNGGAIVGGEQTGVGNRIPPGATVALNTFMFLDIPVDEVICRAYA